jgi:hypothetical protein
MKQWYMHISDMLRHVNDVLNPHGFEEILKDDFAALRQMLHRTGSVSDADILHIIFLAISWSRCPISGRMESIKVHIKSRFNLLKILFLQRTSLVNKQCLSGGWRRGELFAHGASSPVRSLPKKSGSEKEFGSSSQNDV